MKSNGSGEGSLDISKCSFNACTFNSVLVWVGVEAIWGFLLISLLV